MFVKDSLTCCFAVAGGIGRGAENFRELRIHVRHAATQSAMIEPFARW
jgi:hypothetical protein